MPAARGAPITSAVLALGDGRCMPDVAWVASLLGITTSDAEHRLDEIAEHLKFEHAIHDAHLGGGREFYAQLRAPFELYALVRALHPTHVVETGVSSGVSSAHILLALQQNGGGVLHSIDFPTRQAGRTFQENESPVALPPGTKSGWAIPEPLKVGWDLRVGKSEELLPPLLDELPEVGLFLHDSLHTPKHLAFELATVRPKLRPGSLVLADNTEWTGRAFDEFAEQVGAPVFRRGGSDLVGIRIPSATAARSSKPRTGRRQSRK